MKRLLFSVFFPLVTLMFSSCEKFLSERNTSMVTNINSLQDMQALMDATNQINSGYSGLIEIATDDFFLGPNGLQNANEMEKSMYKWDSYYSYPFEYMIAHWRSPFHIIAIANNVLDELSLLEDTTNVQWRQLKGAALFHRAFTYCNLIQVYCKAYDSSTSSSDLGLPIRRDADVSELSVRASLEETIQFVEQDLKQAIALLPNYSEYKTRPSKPSAHALLARLYLNIGSYSEALEQANLSLEMNDQIMDFNAMDTSLTYPIQALNPETIYFAYANGASFVSQSPYVESYVDTTLYHSYHENDLRKKMFFQDEGNGYFTFKGSYHGFSSGTCFIGLTVSELLLIKAESLARLGNVNESIETLNKLLKNRYKMFVDHHVDDYQSEDVLLLVLEERRKELIFRGSRWADLKRLNLDPQYAKTLYRKTNGGSEIFELPPNDPRYVFLIPQEVIELTGMKQNPR